MIFARCNRQIVIVENTFFLKTRHSFMILFSNLFLVIFEDHKNLLIEKEAKYRFLNKHFTNWAIFKNLIEKVEMEKQKQRLEFLKFLPKILDKFELNQSFMNRLKAYPYFKDCISTIEVKINLKYYFECEIKTLIHCRNLRMNVLENSLFFLSWHEREANAKK